MNLTNGCWITKIFPTKILLLENKRPAKKGLAMRDYFLRPVLDKKDPPKDMELPNPSEPLSKVIPSSSIPSCNAEASSWNNHAFKVILPFFELFFQDYLGHTILLDNTVDDNKLSDMATTS